jgi:hypothetical protein
LSIDAELRHDLGYAIGTLIFAALFVVAVTAQIRAKRFVIPRKRESSPGAATGRAPARRQGWIPACAGMTSGCVAVVPTHARDVSNTATTS